MPTISLPLRCFLQTTNCSHSSEHRRRVTCLALRSNPPLISPRPPSWAALWSGRVNQMSWSIQLIPPATLAWGCKRTNTALPLPKRRTTSSLSHSPAHTSSAFPSHFSADNSLATTLQIIDARLNTYNFPQHLQKSRPHRFPLPQSIIPAYDSQDSFPALSWANLWWARMHGASFQQHVSMQ